MVDLPRSTSRGTASKGEQMSLVAGIDVATAAVRAVIVDADGREQAAAHASLPAPTIPEPGWSEQDATSWWPTVASVLSDVVDQLGPERSSLAAVSVCATSGTVVALDDGGQPVAPALTYADQRAVDEADLAHRAGAKRWADLGLHVGASFGLPKWAWLLAQPELAAVTSRVGHASDVVVAQLIGELPPTDWSHALKSGYDPERREWASEAMAELGIPLELLPEVGRPTEAVGTVSHEASRATGLPRSCAVRLGMTDGCAAQLAAGACTPGQFVSVLGSTLVLKGASHHLVADPAGAVYSHRHPDGWWLPGGASSAGARALTTGFADQGLATLDDLAAAHGPARGIVYPLLDRGERFPFVAPDAEGFTLGDVTDDVERYRATLEGVAFLERLGYERLASLGASVEPPVSVSGGGSASRIWSRIRATVLNLPVVEKPTASSALGAAMLAAAGTLHPDLTSATEAMAATGDTVQPDPSERDELEGSYQRFLAALTERGWLSAEQAHADDHGRAGIER